MLRRFIRPSLPDKAIEFAGFVLVHCAAIADANRQGELICPFVVLADDSGRRVIAFESETQEEAISKAWSSLAEAQAGKVWWAMGREGIYRDPDGTGTDVLTVSVWIPRMKTHYSWMQRFGRSSDQAVYFIGEPEMLMHEAESATTVPAWDRSALQRGISSHPRAQSWASWCLH